jgi:hypothetical protein
MLTEAPSQCQHYQAVTGQNIPCKPFVPRNGRLKRYSKKRTLLKEILFNLTS